MYSWYEKHKWNSSWIQRATDAIAAFAGSLWFLAIHVIWFAYWIVTPVEPFPYGLLTMIVSLEAIFLSTIIMISQNRAGERDRAQAEHDYEVNREAKREIETLITTLERIDTNKLDILLKNGEAMNKMIDALAMPFQTLKTALSIIETHEIKFTPRLKAKKK